LKSEAFSVTKLPTAGEKLVHPIFAESCPEKKFCWHFAPAYMQKQTRNERGESRPRFNAEKDEQIPIRALQLHR